MKISCIQENLKQGLSLVSNITSKNINLPILNNVLIDVKDGLINLSATNLEIGIKCSIRGKIENDGSFTADAKLLSDYINLLPKERIDVELIENQLSIKCNNNKTKVKGISSTDFPLIPEVAKERPFVCNAEKLRLALSQVISSAAKNESRPEICGVYFHFKDKVLTITATDSYRLAERKVQLEDTSFTDEKEFIVPVRTLQEVTRILGSYRDNIDLPENINMHVSDGQILFVYDVVDIVSRLIEGSYPDYRQIIPNNKETTSIVNVSDLVKAVKTASLFSKSGINDVNLEFISPSGDDVMEGKIHVSSMDDKIGENLSSVDAHVSGLKNGIVLNYQFLLDGLSNMNTNEVEITLIDSSSPCVLRPLDPKTAGTKDEYLYIVMPIRQ